uniref:Putative metalloprotease n=1 Tax=Ixodes ricinus TaxID=34613 RepID=A0A0K8RFL8_IXORI
MTTNERATILENKKNTVEYLYQVQEFGITQNFSSDYLFFLLHPYQLAAIDEYSTSFFDGFCKATGYGFGHDDAITFSGVTMAARLFARLLGANVDKISGCEDSTYLMANSRTSPDKHTLSNCSRRDIQNKLEKIKNSNCLSTNYFRPVNSTYLPSDFLKERDTCTLNNENYTFCNSGTEHKKAFVVDCSIACCKGGPNDISVILAPDGTKSDECQLCLAGKCTESRPDEAPQSRLW